MALRKIDPDNRKSLHVSFDIDSLDPLEAPSTGTPGANTYTIRMSTDKLIFQIKLTQLVRGGLSLREGIHLMEELYRTCRLHALDLVEVNPEIGDQRSVDLTVSAAIQIIQAGFGYTRRGLKVSNDITDMPLQTFKS